jgi:hypothetical protein
LVAAAGDGNGLFALHFCLLAASAVFLVIFATAGSVELWVGFVARVYGLILSVVLLAVAIF